VIARANVADSLLVVVDFQSAHLSGLQTSSAAALSGAIDALCTGARLHGVPVIVTGAELAGVRPAFAGGIDGTNALWRSTADAFASPAFGDTVSASGRHTLLFAGVATDVGVALAALSARALGYTVMVVLDACGADSERAERAAVARLASAGIALTSVGAVLAEWQGDFAREHGAETLRLIGVRPASG
jgi:nicotinamidase-related amidase